MYKLTIKMMTAAAVISTGFSVAHADETFSKAEINKQIQICSKKKQGDWVTFANKGVTVNGTCEQNENGKLQFSFPAPVEGSATAAAQAIQDRPAQEAPAPVAVPAAPAGFAPGEPAQRARTHPRSPASSVRISEQPLSTLTVARSSPRVGPRFTIAIGIPRAAACRTNR